MPRDPLLILLVIQVTLASAQQRSIIGRVLDSATDLPVKNAAVVVLGAERGTYTNHLGFFAMDLKPESKTLIISCLGYETSKVQIPDQDQFRMSMKRYYAPLEHLDMATFERQDNKKKAQDPEYHSGGTDASYPGGWWHFYNDLAVSIDSTEFEELLNKTVTKLRFEIDAVGKLNLETSTTDSIVTVDEWRAAITTLKDWQPAVQNNSPTLQWFEIPIAWSKLHWVLSSEQAGDNPAQAKALSMEEMGPSLYQFLWSNIRYPAQARRVGIEGRVLIGVKIDKSGSILEMKKLQDIGAECGNEVIRVLGTAPTGIYKGLSGRFETFIVSVVFGLQGKPRIPPPSMKEMYGVLLPDLDIIAVGVERERKVVGFSPYTTIGMSPPKPKPMESYAGSIESAIEMGVPIKKLDQSFKDIVEIPKGISRIDQLVEIDMEGNQIEKIPDEFAHLKLKRLLMPDNRLTSLPPFFADINSLRVLSLAKNKFSEFPSAILGLSKLEQLDLAGNDISVLPVEIFQMKNLRELFLQDNNIVNLPDSFFSLKKLRILNLEGNPLDDATRTRLKKTFPNANL